MGVAPRPAADPILCDPWRVNVPSTHFDRRCAVGERDQGIQGTARNHTACEHQANVLLRREGEIGRPFIHGTRAKTEALAVAEDLLILAGHGVAGYRCGGATQRLPPPQPRRRIQRDAIKISRARFTVRVIIDWAPSRTTAFFAPRISSRITAIIAPYCTIRFACGLWHFLACPWAPTVYRRDPGI